MYIIQVTDCRYHRNGVGGIGFAAVRFSFVNDNGFRVNAVATVFEPEQEGEQIKATGYCAVLVLGDKTSNRDEPQLNQPMRGDNFELELRRFIQSDEGQTMMWPFRTEVA